MRADATEQKTLDAVTRDGHYDPADAVQREALLTAFNVQITKDEEESYPGWCILWKHGGGLVCPLSFDEDTARSVIVLALYLDLCGVDVALSCTLAYLYFKERVR